MLDVPNLTPFGQAVFSINLVTLALFLLAQAFFYSRESWIIEHLECSSDTLYSNLPVALRFYSDLERVLSRLNASAYSFACIVLGCVALNFVLSAAYIFGDPAQNHSLGSRSVIGILTNSMLLAPSICYAVVFTRRSVTNGWALSLFQVLPASFNSLDSNWKLHHASSAN